MPICPLRHSQKSRQSRFNVSIKYQWLVILYIYIPILLVKVIQCLPHFFWWWFVSWLLLAIFSIAAAWDIQQTLFCVLIVPSVGWERKPHDGLGQKVGVVHIYILYNIIHLTALWPYGSGLLDTCTQFPCISSFFWLQKWHPLFIDVP